MRYLKQLVTDHDPDANRYGDCWRTVLACLLDCERVTDVPNFAQIAGKNGGLALTLGDKWLAEHGYSRIVFAFDDSIGLDYIDKAMHAWNPDIPYCLIGDTPRGHTHVAIYCNGELVHDPHPDGTGITAPVGGYYWIEIVAKVPT